MKALTLHQPWASLIALGHKRIETRSWSTPYRGPLAIHAGKSLRGWGRKGTRTPLGDFEVERFPETLLLRGESLSWPYALPLGLVVATAQLVDVVPIHEQLCRHDAPDRYLYVGVTAAGGHSMLDLLTAEDSAVHGDGIEQFSPDLPYGLYECGRYAWLLDDVKPIPHGIRATGHQGLWDWSAP